MSEPKKRSRSSKRKIIYGVGINDADYEVYQCRRVEGKMVVDWVCPYYSRWLDMIRRCYSPKQKAKQRNYEHCTTSEEWKTFSNFKKWMERQDWEGKQLDKDLLVFGNSEYNENYCIFVTSEVNSFLKRRIDKNFPTGLSNVGKSSYILQVKTGRYNESSRKQVKSFQDALDMWRDYKEYILERLLLDGVVSNSLYDTLENRINDYYHYYKEVHSA